MNFSANLGTAIPGWICQQGSFDLSIGMLGSVRRLVSSLAGSLSSDGLLDWFRSVVFAEIGRMSHLFCWAGCSVCFELFWFFVLGVPVGWLGTVLSVGWSHIRVLSVCVSHFSRLGWASSVGLDGTYRSSRLGQFVQSYWSGSVSCFGSIPARFGWVDSASGLDWLCRRICLVR